MTTLGIALGDVPYEVLPDLAARAEAGTFETLWVSETTQDSLIQATVAGLATSRIRIGTAATIAFPRSPTVLAMAAWDLNKLTNHRFAVGLGSQVRRVIEDRFSAPFERPTERMAEYVHAMRTCWRMERGEDVTFDGDFYRVLRPGPNGLGHETDHPQPDVYIAAVGPRMTRVAATHADGLLGHPFTAKPYFAEHVRPRVEGALTSAGRSRGSFTIAQGLIVSVSDDRDQAIRDAKQQVAFYGTTPNYRGVFESHGQGALTDDLREAWRKSSRDVDGLVRAVPDDAIGRYAIAGTPDEVREQIQEWTGLADHLILSSPWFGVPTSRMVENIRIMLDVFRE